jgi:putative ABC transport system permease protein
VSGTISQIDIELTPSADASTVMDRLQRRLGPAVTVQTQTERREETAGLLSAFRLNLTALSLISVFVGLFLVFSSTQASLVRRRTEFGVLRSLGATRGQLLVLVVTQTAVLGALGVALGLPLGYWVAAANVEVVSGTLTNIYLLSEIEQVHVPFTLVLLAAGIGVGGAVAGAVLPAIDMARRDPSALLSPYTLHEKVHDVAGLLAVLGLSILAASGLWYAALGRHWQPAGFVLAVGLLVGLPFLTPLIVRSISTPIRARDFTIRFSIRSLAVRLQSTSIAVASLAVAVSMLAGITIMIGSFRQTLEVWVDATVQADIYVTSESWARSIDRAPLDSLVVAGLAAAPGVVAVDRLRGFLGYTDTRRIFVAGVDTRTARSDTRFLLLDGDPETALTLVREEEAILISEPLARRTNTWAGDSLAIVAPAGPTPFLVAGVRYDYGNEAGSVIMDLTTLDSRFGPGPINSVALYMDPAIDVDRAVDGLKAQFRDVPLLIRSNRLLRSEVLNIFDQTFAITRILQVMCLLVAACGIMLTLLILARERISELALYRALGASRAQIFSIFLGKGAFMGALGMALGGVGGVILAAVLIFVVNRAYFGWTVQVSWPVGALLGQAATILAAAIGASLYPAFRAARVPATELSREDV